MKISARNALRGRLKSIERGAENAEIVIELDGGPELVSIITLESADRLDLVPGQAMTAIIKSSDVLIAVD